MSAFSRLGQNNGCAGLQQQGVECAISRLPQDDPTQRKPDTTFAKETLGWEAKVSLETGLERTIAYFRKALASIDAGHEIPGVV